ncbi:Sensor histidine kinase DcuS [Planococcus massiliensis]|uniref:histidine kinase n=1 Tax=Planococcus massiliensis TaxID=1499687 RepID=A0A098ENI5_9BACL|nr:sensor histidine kinase [Planococcus massiliensis]CEG22866.1 Sensor histidine kinase DcuS [Planococcus massiliensis]
MIHFPKNENQKRTETPKNRWNLKMKMVLLIGFLIITVVAVTGVFLNYFVTDTLKGQLGEQALALAESVALNPEIAEAFHEPDPAFVIQPLISPLQKATDAEFIVVGNREEIRYSHPAPEKIGQKMVGEDNEQALVFGNSYVSEATGSLGSSLRAKVPIYEEGDIIGVVSVGFLATDIQTLIKAYNQELWLMLLLIAAAGFLAAIGIASYIKRLLHGLEPEEIAHLLFQKETILQSTHEGIIAVDATGRITLLNQMAKRLLFGGNGPAEKLIGEPIAKAFPDSELPDILKSAESRFDKERMYGRTSVYVNSGPIYVEGELVGAVSTFRYKTEIDKLTKELSRVTQYAQALRAQTHEFSNKLYTISGLLHLNKKEEVLEFLQLERHTQQEWTRYLVDKVRDPLISGLLLGKFHQANEQHVAITIEPESRLIAELTAPQQQAILTALGSLLDNALEAVRTAPSHIRQISLYFTDVGEDLLFEIDDSGSGLADADAGRLFDKGYSIKMGRDRGYGLYTAHRLVETAGGDLHLEESELGGTCFVISLPKEANQR